MMTVTMVMVIVVDDGNGDDCGVGGNEGVGGRASVPSVRCQVHHS